MNIEKLNKKRIRRRISGMDVVIPTVVDTSIYEKNREENLKTLELWRRYYDDLSGFRKRYLRNFDYNIGNQLEKEVRDSKGRRKTQRVIIEEDGKTPIIINVIREMVRTVLGQYRMNPSRSVVFARKEDDKVSGEMLTLALHAALERNDFRELDAQMMEILLLSGFSCSRVIDKFYDSELQQDAYIKNMNPCLMFFNGDLHDVRGDDIHVIGEIIETTVDTIVSTYANSYQELVALKKILIPMSSEYIGGSKSLNADKYRQSDFYTPSEPSNIRVYYGWTKKNEFRVLRHDPIEGSRDVIKGDISRILFEIEKENIQRASWLEQNKFTQEEIMLSLIKGNIVNYTYWEYKVLTRDGHCIAQGESPFEHHSHPYSILLRPLVNGHVAGIVDDIVDMQDVINQTFMTFKWMVEASAKGLLLVPEDCIPPGMDINDFAEQWSKVGGVIKIKLKPGAQLPVEINSVSNQNVKELLNFALEMMDKVSGIHGALRGEKPNAGTPSSLYAQQAQNSAVSILNLFKSFEHYIRDRDKKTLKTIMQIYDNDRYIDLYGESISDEAKRWDRTKVKDVEFDLLVTSTADNPFYKLLMDDKLLSLLNMKMITAKAYLRNSNEPFAKKLLNDLEKEEQESMMQQQPGMQQEGMQQAAVQPQIPELQQ